MERGSWGVNVKIAVGDGMERSSLWTRKRKRKKGDRRLYGTRCSGRSKLPSIVLMECFFSWKNEGAREKTDMECWVACGLRHRAANGHGGVRLLGIEASNERIRGSGSPGGFENNTKWRRRSPMVWRVCLWTGPDWKAVRTTLYGLACSGSRSEAGSKICLRPLGG